MWDKRGVVPIIIAIVLVVAQVAPVFAFPLTQSADENLTVFVPLVSSFEVPVTGQAETVDGEPVYGLLGRINFYTNRRYVNYLTTSEGLEYALAGETPEVEGEIDQLSSARPPMMVKVWGTIRVKTVSADEPLIVVTGILPAGPAPSVTGFSVPVAIVRFDLVNLRDIPQTNGRVIGQVTLNQACDVIGKNRTETWLQMLCADGLTGWIDSRLVEVEGDLGNVPVVETATAPVSGQAEPTPVPTAIPAVGPLPQSPDSWTMSMYDNRLLSGSPVAVSSVEAINFNWQSGSPSASLPVDEFSIRFERLIDFIPGYYRFVAQADDGVRVWLDEQLLIDEWHGASGQVYSVGRTLSGRHTVRVEYYEGSGQASLRVAYELLPQEPAWDVSYYRGINLEGTPVLVQQEPRSQNPLDQNWTYGSPAPDVLGNDIWSARWTGQFEFEAGTYIFRVLADDGVRVYVDGLAVIDRWTDGFKEVSNRFVDMGAGPHTITVEYYDRQGPASLKLWWYLDTSE